ncbi:MAG TPA: hypothetical protein VHX13_12985 [Acidobacteriaceae bacterium]|jgi:hypothetical protein|nr:hypothetical protein [Acidobacteriaceae bacterium]
MPHLSFFSWAVWIGIIALQPAVLYRLVRSGLWKRWLSLTVFLSLKSVGSLLLLAIYTLARNPDGPYFYVYWCFAGLAAITEIWMIIQVGCAMAGLSRSMRNWIAHATLAIAAATLTVFIPAALHSHRPVWGILSHSVLGLNEAVNLAWLVTFGIVLCLYELFDIESFGAVRGIASGFALMALGASLCGWLYEFTGNVTAISNLQDLAYFLSLLVWAVAVRRGRREFQPDLIPRLQVVVRSKVVETPRARQSRI